MRRAVRAEYISSSRDGKACEVETHTPRVSRQRKGERAGDSRFGLHGGSREHGEDGLPLGRVLGAEKEAEGKEEISRAGHALSDVRIVVRSGRLPDGALVTGGVVIAWRGRVGGRLDQECRLAVDG